MIPKDKKKMQKISESRMEGVAVIHEKYVFFLDVGKKIHRWDRTTGEDKVISSIEAMVVDCMGEGLYVQECNLLKYLSQTRLVSGLSSDVVG